MALLPGGWSPRSDGILGQVQGESKSPFLFTSGHVLRYIEYSSVHHARVLAHEYVDAVRADRSKPLETCPSSRRECCDLPGVLLASW